MPPKKKNPLEGKNATVCLDLGVASMTVECAAADGWALLAELMRERAKAIKKFPELLMTLPMVGGGSVDSTEDEFDTDDTGRRIPGFRVARKRG